MTAGTMGRKAFGALMSLTLLGAIFAPAAHATAGLTSYQGDDYSRDINNITQVKACDGESDGNDVHADFYAVGDGSLHQVHTAGGYGHCEDSGVFSAHIYSHRAVEEVFGEDPKGDWVYPS